MPFGIGPTELIIFFVIALIIFGPKKLPEMGKSMGKGIREFKTSLTGDDDDDRPATTQASAQPAQPQAVAQTLPPAAPPPTAATTDASASGAHR